MAATIRTALSRHDRTLIADTLGALSLAVILVGALHLPVFV